MIHHCKIQCHSVDPSTLDMIGIQEDPGMWLPFAFLLDVVIACKLTSDDEEEETYGCTTIFTEHGDTYVINTNYNKFNKLWESYVKGVEMKETEL